MISDHVWREHRKGVVGRLGGLILEPFPCEKMSLISKVLRSCYSRRSGFLIDNTLMQSKI